VENTAARILAGLDDEQRAVAEAVEGPVVVLAGAGTGKTRAITHRIAYGVETGAHDPRRSLAVTFTNRAAGEMRGRLRTLGVEGVQVRTFHAAALRQLRYFWPRLSGNAFPELIASKSRLVVEAARTAGLATNSALLRDLASDIEWAKVSQLDAEGLLTSPVAASRNWSVDLAQFAKVFSAYDEIKHDRGLLDFEDVLLVTVGALTTRPDIADEIQSAYRWFTVDEYQDVNPLQHRLLTLWRGDRDDLCVVGDASQTIYSFTGARSEYLRTFRTEFPDATEVRLVRCYRCTPEIVSVANSVISASPGALALVSQQPAGPEPTIESCADDPDEAMTVANRIRARIDSGIAPRDIAVLFRVNAQSAELETALADRGIPVVLRGVERFFDRPEVREGITRLRGAARAGGLTGPLADDVAAILTSAGWTPEAPRTSGAVRERWESLAALVALASEIDAQVGGDLTAFIAELDHRAEVQHAPTADGVTLASLHSAKGLEWDSVYLVGCSEGLLPLSYAETPEAIEEERRLCYVGMTRAKNLLHMTWSRSRTPGGRASRSVSRFIAALDDSAPERSTTGVMSRGKSRGERSRKGPANCRICGKGLVTAPERTIGRCRTCPSTYDEDVLDNLRRWRLHLSREKKAPAYVIFTDATLVALAEQMPTDEESLMEIPGIGPSKIDQYGEAVLSVLEAGYPVDEG
jgi:DNA helicase-2/ATP-dependent DNA helicase PcrA